MFKIQKGELKHKDRILGCWRLMMEEHKNYSPLFRVTKDSDSKYLNYLVGSLKSDNVIYGIAIATDTSDIMGYIRSSIVNRAPIFQFSRIGMINEIFIMNQFRNSGLGTALVNWTIPWFRERKVEYLEIEVAAQNIQGIRFWQKHEFKQYKLKLGRLI